MTVTNPRPCVWTISVKGDLGLKEYYVVTLKGGVPGEVEAKDAAEKAYNDELEKAKDHTIVTRASELDIVRGGKD